VPPGQTIQAAAFYQSLLVDSREDDVVFCPLRGTSILPGAGRFPGGSAAPGTLTVRLGV
jgi:hypothetical protein